MGRRHDCRARVEEQDREGTAPGRADRIDAKTIADVLGHERVDTTMGYVKVSTENLRRVAAPWPGEGLR